MKKIRYRKERIIPKAMNPNEIKVNNLAFLAAFSPPSISPELNSFSALAALTIPTIPSGMARKGKGKQQQQDKKPTTVAIIDSNFHDLGVVNLDVSMILNFVS